MKGFQGGGGSRNKVKVNEELSTCNRAKARDKEIKCKVKNLGDYCWSFAAFTEYIVLSFSFCGRWQIYNGSVK